MVWCDWWCSHNPQRLCMCTPHRLAHPLYHAHHCVLAASWVTVAAWARVCQCERFEQTSCGVQLCGVFSLGGSRFCSVRHACEYQLHCAWLAFTFRQVVRCEKDTREGLSWAKVLLQHSLNGTAAVVGGGNSAAVLVIELLSAHAHQCTSLGGC